MSRDEAGAEVLQVVLGEVEGSRQRLEVRVVLRRVLDQVLSSWKQPVSYTHLTLPTTRSV